MDFRSFFRTKPQATKKASPWGDKVNCPQGKRGRPGAGAELVEAERGDDYQA